MFDTTQLTRSSSKMNLRWRDPSLTLILLSEKRPICVAHLIADKIDLLTDCSGEDVVLAVRQVNYPMRQEVMVVDEISPVLDMLRRDT